jgi:hypothetical protein
VPGTKVTVNFTINNPQSDSNDFPVAADLEMFSELEKATWSIAILYEGEQKPLPVIQRASVRLSEWGMNGFNRNTVHEQAMVTLSGHAPRVEQTMKKTVIRISQLDSNHSPITGSNVTVTPIVVNTCCLSPLLPMKSDLQAFRSHIDEKGVMGINTSSAEIKYQVAKEKIDAAGVLPLNQYETALTDLNAARNAIYEGEKALDKAWAEREVANAQVNLKKVDGIIGWLLGNASTATDYPLKSYIAERDEASEILALAKGDIENGNYSLARSKAEEVYMKANGSYYNATSRREQLFTCDFCYHSQIPAGIFAIAAGIAAIVLFIAGIIWWKKR